MKVWYNWRGQIKIFWSHKNIVQDNDKISANALSTIKTIKNNGIYGQYKYE